ncbi:MAG: hypothetical protein KatS3mg109_0415 [Pirellulaceae bacterium]|nr:MAG: hypothetical protein KatS3mg109_0415 [Pirellulaceae bacterium]
MMIARLRRQVAEAEGRRPWVVDGPEGIESPEEDEE